MQEYENLIEALVAMSTITRPKPGTGLARDGVLKSADDKRNETIQHGIADLLEDAAVAIDDLMKKVPNEKRECAEAA